VAALNLKSSKFSLSTTAPVTLKGTLMRVIDRELCFISFVISQPRQK